MFALGFLVTFTVGMIFIALAMLFADRYTGELTPKWTQDQKQRY